LPVGDNILKHGPHLLDTARIVEPADSRARVCNHRRERLADFVRNACSNFAKRPHTRRMSELRLRLMQLLGRLMAVGHLANDADNRVVVATHETRLEVVIGPTHRQRVVERDRLTGCHDPFKQRLNRLRQVLRQHIAYMFAEKLLRRYEERRRTWSVVIEIDAVATEHEHQIGNRTENGTVSGFGSAQGAFGTLSPPPLSQKACDERELTNEDSQRNQDKFLVLRPENRRSATRDLRRENMLLQISPRYSVVERTIYRT